MAAQRDYDIVHEYTDKMSGTKNKRRELDKMLAAAHRGEFDVLVVFGLSGAPTRRPTVTSTNSRLFVQVVRNDSFRVADQRAVIDYFGY